MRGCVYDYLTLSDLDMRPLVPGAYDTVLQHRAGPLLILLQHHTLQGGPQQVVIGQRKSLKKIEVSRPSQNILILLT